LLYWILLPDFLSSLRSPLAILGGFVAGVWAAVGFVTPHGRRSFPPAPNATLPEVLKALSLQKVFTRFAIDHQFESVDSASARVFHERFEEFIESNKPDDLDGSTQEPGVIGI
jgi:hypothetical protein